MTLIFVVATLVFIQSFFSVSINIFDAPGTMYTIETFEKSFKVHVSCQSSEDDSPYTVILLSSTGAPGMSLVGIQESLVEMKYKACYIDRPGYGYSDPGLYLPHSPDNNNKVYSSIISKMNVKEFVVIGHSTGGQEGLRLCGSFSSCHGAILLDSFQDDYLREVSSNIPSSNWYGATDEAIEAEYGRVSSSMTTSRVFYSWAIPSFIVGHQPNFQPSDKVGELVAHYRQDKTFQSQQIDFHGRNFSEWPYEHNNFTIFIHRAYGNCTNKPSTTSLNCDQLNEDYNAVKKAAEKQVNITGIGAVTFCQQPCDHSFPYTQLNKTIEYLDLRLSAINANLNINTTSI